MLNKSKLKILVAMSGGVDSSVVAALLVEQGYDVTGAFMINYNEGDGNCWHLDYQDALRVCAKLGIQLLKLDFTKEYKRDVLDYMYAEYKAGQTPNPDVLCNKYIKFGVWLDWAIDKGFNYLATGHYVRLSGKLPILKIQIGKDKEKDQTYFLHQLDQKQLQHTLFPLGDYTKTEVRKLAKKFDLSTANKSESMGICFIGEVPMKEFLQKRIKNKVGDILDSSGKLLDKHDGLAFYTIGQRIGLSSVIPAKAEIQSRKAGNVDSHRHGEPLFVVNKNIKKNQLIVGCKDDPLLYKKKIELKNIHWISGQIPIFPLKCKVRLRHRQELQNCVVNNKNNKIVVIFSKKQRAVTSGQFAVFYKNKECLGGGVI